MILVGLMAVIQLAEKTGLDAIITFRTDDDDDDVLVSASYFLKPRGCIVQVKSSATRTFHVNGPRSDISVHSIDLGSFLSTQNTMLTRMKKLMDQGLEKEAVVPLPMETFKVDKLQEAFQALADIHLKKKVVLKVSDSSNATCKLTTSRPVARLFCGRGVGCQIVKILEPFLIMRGSCDRIGFGHFGSLGWVVDVR